MSWCHRLIAHDWLLSVCRPHPATSSTFVFDQFYGHCASQSLSLSAPGTRSSRLSRSRPPSMYLFLSRSLFYSLLFLFSLRVYLFCLASANTFPLLSRTLLYLSFPFRVRLPREERPGRTRATTLEFSAFESTP